MTKEERRLYQREWRERNKERIKEYEQQEHVKEMKRAASRRAHQKHKEQEKEYRERPLVKKQRKEYERGYRETIVGRFKEAIKAAKRRGIGFNLSLDEYTGIVAHACCSYCYRPLNKTGCGLDRKNNAPCYSVKTVLPCCGRCNKVFMDSFSYKEKLMLAETIRQIDKLRGVRNRELARQIFQLCQLVLCQSAVVDALFVNVRGLLYFQLLWGIPNRLREKQIP